VIACWYFGSEAKASNRELSKVRHEVLKKYRNSDQVDGSGSTKEA